jgi:Flp pilus assembly protein CpaB
VISRNLMWKKTGLLASLVAALGAAALAHVYMQKLEDEVSGGPRIPILVAAEDVPIGSTLAEKVLAVRDLPRAYVEPRHIRASDLKKVIGVRVTAGLKANDTVLWSDLSQFSEHAKVLSGLIQNGLRAVAIDGRALDFEGLLRPGDRVDVLFTNTLKDDGASATFTILQNLLVLSVGGSIARGNGQPPSATVHGTSVTVSATIEQAQLLTQAQLRGRINLSLRNSDDTTVVENVPETHAKDLQTAKDRLDWRGPRSTQAKEIIEHVR